MAGTRRLELRGRVVAGVAFADKPPEEDRTLHDMGRAGMSVVLVAVNEALATALENRPGDGVRAVKAALIAPGDEPGSGGQFTLRTDRALSRQESGRRHNTRVGLVARTPVRTKTQDPYWRTVPEGIRHRAGRPERGRTPGNATIPGKDRRWMAWPLRGSPVGAWRYAAFRSRFPGRGTSRNGDGR